MREQDIQDLIIRQRPYYHLEGTPIRGLDHQYSLVFKHQDADSLLKNVIRFLGLLRAIDLNSRSKNTPPI
jgi:hypothetical protein